MTFRTGLFAAAATASLASCGGMQTTATDDGSLRTGAGTAENACITAVNVNMAGGSSTVIASEPSGSGTLVVLRSRDGTNWRCLVSGSGVVADLSVV